ncbi:sialic acid binding Ig-like lectin 15, like isoform X1 [Onychostoma macrolepis]|uniref:Ig-like domain-containing protein n=1 Tax=Onychostoma macrolepis TaxID=369639 RepID=A0A7J6CAP3_9TELE|nr:sialic acid binding Ig-like lectin 15, like isoform X1 [Onychostoma macrolepis]XP_058601671.1 sialic acid binding Ig-like lectin 15, like isoform X1 [Onychostoma macrolepis]XP_058601672.1 sialic acid binding Ig-like lectin 15, like isoform X1 [Onychostoma macrolepis]XP_058601673.1 sialic acid binding Ig-like lectin 15, like isoform X1 [Onychostoma macrolepis]XP_058601674.1 sialic acid binding Ig-like lectin 15, like isoform X1 [Onychostoma macrolepis]XP_058601676.1 sialic acid binding Ig-li
MFSPKMQDYVFGLLSFICSLKGLSCTLWTMKVEDQVNGTLGQNVILPCFFTHPKQNAYTGDITVKWMQDKKIEPIFQCKFHNKTNGQDSNCIEQSLSERHLLQGNHRKGDISLRINNLQFTDASQYTCRVELDYDKFNKHTTLNVNAPAQILSLYLDLDVVKCIARGNPLPQIKWTSSSGPLKNIPFKTDPRKYIVNSSVPFSDQAVYTCQVVNSLGQDQKAFPPNHPNCLSLSVVTGILACLLLLGLIAVILDVVKRRKNAQRVMLQDMGVQRVQTSVYQDNKTVYANINICPVGRETRQVGVYSTGSLREGRKKEMIPGAPKIRPPRPPGPPPDIDKK